MKLVAINWDPTDRQLRQFSLACLIVFPFMTWLWRGGPSAIGFALGIGCLCVLGGWLKPQSLRPLYLMLSLIAAPIGIVVGEILLLLIYFVVMVPIGLVLRLRRRDALQLKLDRSAESYWSRRKQSKDAASYFRQY